MAKVGAQRAAELTGKSKSTIQRSMNSGKLSYEVDVNQRRIIDVSELERVFGLAPSGTATAAAPQANAEDEMKKVSDMLEMERMKMRIKALETQLETTQVSLDDLKVQRDQWQKQAQQVLLTSQYSQKQAEELKTELRDREERARQQREKRLAERMEKLQNDNQNDRSVRHSTQEEEDSSKFNFQGIWQKLKDKTAA